MATWNGEYVHPYAEHGKKSEQVKKNHRIDSIKRIKSTDGRAYTSPSQ